MNVGKIYTIKQGDDKVFLCRGINSFDIAIPFNNENEFHESFVGIKLLTSTLNIEKKKIKVVCLIMQDTGDLKKFSYIGAEFIDIKHRDELLSNLYKWVDEWKEIFGDSKKKYMITDVLAELISLKYIFSKNKTAKWEGSLSGTHDIVFDNGVIEVKSTTKKTDNYISINSAFQINHDINQEIHLVRLEHKPYAQFCIDTLVSELTSLGYNEDELENNLKEMGYIKGSRVRKRTFAVLSLNSYKVNEENFPIFSLEYLNSLTKPKNIVNYQLTLDLSSIEHESLIKNA